MVLRNLHKKLSLWRRFAFVLPVLCTLSAGAWAIFTYFIPYTQRLAPRNSQAYLWDDRNFGDRKLTVRFQQDILNMEKVKSDDGEYGFGDKVSSVEFEIAEGWCLTLFEHDTYRGRSYKLIGSGKLVRAGNLGGFEDQASSLRWEKINSP